MTERIRHTFFGRGLLLLCALSAPFAVRAEQGKERAVVYDRERGELSPGTEAPSREALMNAIRSASPTALTAMLEYGERVECMECIPPLETKLLSADDPRVRRIAAWWLRRRTFGFERAAVRMRQVLDSDEDPVRRSRAAEALGEFQDLSGLPALARAATADSAPEVRLASVRALGRLNARGGHVALVQAFEDGEVAVRRAALDQVLRVKFFRDGDAVLARLDDEDASVRQRAAKIAGELRLDAGAEVLAELLSRDPSGAVRQAAAWALGRIGGADARAALRAAGETESDPRVHDAIEIAILMAR